MTAKRRAAPLPQKRKGILPGLPNVGAGRTAGAKPVGGPLHPAKSSADESVEVVMAAFAAYARRCSDEKGDAQVFCDRLFRAFGHHGYKEAGAVLEDRVKMQDGGTRFADLVWKPRVLIEMKKRGEKLPRHYAQAMQYWLRLTPNRPRYVVLCNFDDLWVYDFNTQLDEPMDRLKIDELPSRFTALNFMFPEERTPLFHNNRAAVTDDAAMKMGALFRALVARGETRERAQRFTLQCVVAMFSEDTGLLPAGIFTELVGECMTGRSSYDLLGGLFAQMNRSEAARAGRYKGVRYFNGGIFAVIDPIELNPAELLELYAACDEDWGRINPAIFGTLFQESMEHAERHRRGAHYTPEAEIMRVVLPTIVQPWQARIRRAQSAKELRQIRDALSRVRVLDPSCGSGNFLYVAYRELKRLELTILERIFDEWKEPSRAKTGASTAVQITQFFGIDNDPFAVELAKVTLVLAKKLAIDEATTNAQEELFENPLPLENLDRNIRCDDALFCEWPKATVIIGNPPYQSKNKAQGELSPAYLRRVRARYKGVPGRADYCVYWFRRAHDELGDGDRAGLVGTNTVRQTYSREGGLDYIVANGGTITEAVSTQVWPGRAVLHVSIVNWVKAEVPGKKLLTFQEGDHVDSPWRSVEVERIPASLTDKVDVTAARTLRVNKRSKCVRQGQTPGHDAFVLTYKETVAALREMPRNAEVIFPYVTGDEMLSGTTPEQWRYVVDFSALDQIAARTQHRWLFDKIRAGVLRDRQDAAEEEERRNVEVRADDPKARVNQHHANFLKRWWVLSYPREDLMTKLEGLPRYIACSRVTRRPVFEFISSSVHPSDALTVFPLADDYSFGIFQSNAHWVWFKERCSSLKVDPRYTSTTVFDTFPWPQSPSKSQVDAVARFAGELRVLRRRLIGEHGSNLRDLYLTLDDPGENPLRAAQERLDVAVREAFGMRRGADPLAFLLELNERCSEREARGEEVTGPGVPPGLHSADYVTIDCLQAPSSPRVGRAAQPRPPGLAKGRSYVAADEVLEVADRRSPSSPPPPRRR